HCRHDSWTDRGRSRNRRSSCRLSVSGARGHSTGPALCRLAHGGARDSTYSGMKLLVDMNLSPRWASFLAASRIESTHWSLVGAVTATDVEIMEYAREHGYIVLTHDLDFSAILAVTR